MEQNILSMYDLSGKVAIITGASRGLGISFARGLTKAGCDLTIAARNFDNLKQVAEELKIYGHKIIPVKVDVNNINDVNKMVEETINAFGKIDILVNNAGIAAVVNAEDMSQQQWQSVIDTNVSAVFYCAQCVGKQMLKQGHGKIINIASMYGYVGASYVPQVSYVTSKTAVLGLTRELAVEWAPHGLNVTALAPGFFRSDQTIWAFEEDKELGQKLLAKIPMGRMGMLEELEGTIVYLASSASNYMNGQVLILDGGFLSW